MSVAFRRAAPPDFPEVGGIRRDAYMRAGHFSADHPYKSVLGDVDVRRPTLERVRHRWRTGVPNAGGGIEAISIPGSRFMEQAYSLCDSLGFRPLTQ